MQTNAVAAQPDEASRASGNAVATKRKYAMVSPEGKKAILDKALSRIMEGDRLLDISEDAGVSLRTLKMWLLDLGDEYRQLRNAAIDRGLIEAQEAIDAVGQPTINPETGEPEPIDIELQKLHLARAREQFKARAWIAERRDKRYAAQQSVTAQPFSGGITINIGNVQAPGALIDGTVVDGEASKD